MDSTIMDKLADDVEAIVIKTCAKVAEIHSFRVIENEYQRGYVAAATEIAAKIRELKKGKV